MTSEDFNARVDEVKRRAHGHWTTILGALGVSEAILSGKNVPCPLPGCGGTDRFQYTDKFGEGNYFCRSCGAGGGLKLAQGALGLKFGELLGRVESQVGKVQATKRPESSAVSPLRMKQLAQRIWNEAQPVTPGDEVDRYLRNRGVWMERYPRSLRCHPALGYFVKQGTDKRSTKVAEYPAMLACVQGPDGHAVTLHRTYLKNGQKVSFGDRADNARKLLASGINGATIRLGRPAQVLGITECQTQRSCSVCVNEVATFNDS